MWHLTYRLAEPPLARRLELGALESNQRALELLSRPGEPGAGRMLAESLAGAEACWHAFRFVLGRERWQAVKGNLRRQRECAALLAGEKARLEPATQRRLETLLMEQSRWLGELVDGEPPGEADLRRGIERLYRRARRMARRRARRTARRTASRTAHQQARRPAHSDLHRRLGRLVRVLELLPPAPGCLTTLVAEGRRILDLAGDESGAEALARLLAEPPERFAAELRWACFRGLTEPSPRGGRGGASVDFTAGPPLNAAPPRVGSRNGSMTAHAEGQCAEIAGGALARG